jgi:hypothetical protein
MDSVFIAARAGVDENAAAPSATVAGPNNANLRVIVMGTSLSRETLPQAWRAGEGMSSGKVAPQGSEGSVKAFAHARRDRKKIEMRFAHLECILRLDR